MGTKAEHPYYSFNKVESFQCTYNFIPGGRGIGKTYGAKRRAIRRWIRYGEQFIYLRRFKTELSNARTTFFSDIAHEFPNHIFRIQGNEAQMAKEGTSKKDKDQWHTIGYFIALTTAQSQKSVSFEHVKTIIFDEFIMEKGAMHYLPNEFDVFNNFYNTVDRWKDKTKVFFLANAVSIMNPYFLALEIDPQNADENGILKKADGFVVCHFPDSKLFAMSVFQTKFGKFIRDNSEEYAEYAVGNTFHDANDSMIAPKDPKARYEMTLETAKGTFSVWFNMFTREFTIQEKRPKQEIIYTLLAEKMEEGKILLVFGDKLVQRLRTGFRQGRMTFDRPATRNALIEVFKR